MKLTHLREVFNRFVQSLDDKEKDEYWGTTRGMAKEVARNFMGWSHKNRDWITGIEMTGQNSHCESNLEDVIMYLEEAVESCNLDVKEDFEKAALEILRKL